MKKLIHLLPLLVFTVSCNEFGSRSSEFSALSPNRAIEPATPATAVLPPPVVVEPPVVVQPPQPPVVVQPPQPPVVVQPPQPPVVVQPPQPPVVVQPPQPPVVVQPPQPPVVVEPPQPPVVVQPPQPPVVVQPPQPPVVVQPPQPPVVVQPPQPPVVNPEVCKTITNETGVLVETGHGLMGSIYDGSLMKVNHFSQVKADGVLLQEKIYFPNLNFTHKENLGFIKTDGTKVLNGQGSPLIVNYGIEFDTALSLDDDDDAGDEDGLYQLSVIADDGIVIESPDAQSKKDAIISADHQTPAKYSCSDRKELIKMEKGKPLPVVIKYFQGSSNQMAIILMWRKVKNLDGSLVAGAAESDLHEKRCGQAGNHFFFDLDSGIHPTKDYLDLLSAEKRKIPWKVLKHKNFKLKKTTSNKVCQKN
jgi:hypothetical protein